TSSPAPRCFPRDDGTWTGRDGRLDRSRLRRGSCPAPAGLRYAATIDAGSVSAHVVAAEFPAIPFPTPTSQGRASMEHNPDLPWFRRLHWQVLIAMILGAITGLIFGPPAAERLGWIGDLFMKLLRMIIVPLVLTSIISGVASVGGGKALGRLFSKTIGYYILSSLLA